MNGNDLVVGALVQWTEGQGYGEVTGIDARRISVRWDHEGNPPQFAATNPPLSRVEFSAGHVVQLRSTNETAAVLSIVTTEPPVWSLLVTGQPPRTLNVPEAGLRPQSITDPVERFKSGHIGSLQKYRLQEVTRWYWERHHYDDLVSLGQVGVDLKPHQVSVVHKVVSEYPHRFLLCDEVGLGKTIEAGMALKELRSRGVARRVLAIVPPNLIFQWQFEMKTKFNEVFAILNTDVVRFLQNDSGFNDNPFTYRDSVLCSAAWVVNEPWASQCAAADWDLVIIDEAHHARSRRSGNRIERTLLYQLVNKLATMEHLTRGLLFLTATPMQLDTHELYSLVELLDPALFPSEQHFDRHRTTVPGLSYLVERLSRHGFPLPDETREVTAQQVGEWLDIDCNEAHRRLNDSKELRKLTEDLSERHLLSKVLIRNRKAVVGDFVTRIAVRWEVDLTPKERSALSAVKEYVQYGYQLAEQRNNNAVGFAMVVFQKLMASSIAAIQVALSKRREKIGAGFAEGQSYVDLQARLEEDDDAADVVGDYGLADEHALLDRALAALGTVERDSKACVLVEQISTLFTRHEARSHRRGSDQDDGKIIIFTEFRETQRYLQRLLVDQGWEVNIFHGQLDAFSKDRAVARFRDNVGPQVLISTEAGGEGRNFQFCHMLVNYDLPWNPMRIEQRIGRVDRIGQEHVVKIFNFAVRDTIDIRILDVLEHRIHVFQETVGGLDPILGTAERDLRKIMRQADAQREAAFTEFGQRVADQISSARQAREQLGDFIMDTKSFRKEIVERITGQPSPIDNDRIERFIGKLLASVRTYIKRMDSGYHLTFHGEFYDNHRKSILAGGKKMRAVFRRDRRPDEESVEFLAFGHPIVDTIVQRILAEGYEGVTGTRRIRANDELSPAKGWLFSFQFTVPGVQSTEHIVPVFVNDDGRVDDDAGQVILDRACEFDDHEQEIPLPKIPDNLDRLEPLAKDVVNTIQQRLQRDAEIKAAGRIDREVARLNTWFDYRERVARDRLTATRATLDRLQSSDDDSVRRIIPVWEANLRRDEALPDRLAQERRRRIADIERHRHPQVAWALKSLGRIEIVAPAEGERGRISARRGDDGRIARLERAGTIVRRSSGSPLDVLGQPVRTDANILSALLEERSEEYDEGHR